MIIAGYAIGATTGYIYCRAEYPLALERLHLAIKQAEEKNFLGDNILNSDFSFHIKIKEGAGAFVCGEETALIASIEGERGMPKPRPPFPAVSGLWGKPTIINNVETLAAVARIMQYGEETFSKFGTEESKGTKTFALVGKIKNAGLIEVPMGTTLREIIFGIGGGVQNDRKFKAVQTGGPSGGCIPAEKLDIGVDYESLRAAGSIMGSGGLVVMDEDTCMVDVARYFLEFAWKESCGKCTPCRLGTKQMLDILTDITEGKGDIRDIEVLEKLSEGIIKGSLCGLGQTAPNPVVTTLRYFRHEYEEHILNNRCTARVCRNLIHFDILPEKCTGCHICYKVCPVKAISGDPKQIHYIDQESCIKCGLCLEKCPVKFSAIEKYAGEKLTVLVIMKPITLTIDGRKITTEKGKLLLEAARENGIYIPNLCHHPDLDPTGVCRMCVVEISGRPGHVVSCVTPAEEGMEVRTDTDSLRLTRQISLELLHVNHTQDCTSCYQNNQCKLQEVTAYVGVDKSRLDRMRRTKPEIPADTSNPFFTLDHNKCIMCGICVRTCDEVQGVNALDYMNRGFETVIATFGNKPIVESVCESCGECVARCPVGALYPRKEEVPSREVRTVCTYCGVGCNIILGVRGNRVVRSVGDRESVVNHGRLCVKGRYGWQFINHPDRLRKPLIKKNGEFVEATWDEALTLIAEKFSKSKGKKFASLSSARITNEENYVVQKFTRAVMETNTVDHCARLCHSPTVAGLAQSLGSGAMTNSIGEFRGAKTIFSIGSNTTAAHPIIGLNIRRAKRDGAKIIVANPKEIDLCRHADIFLQQRPGTDVALLMGMMKVIVDEGLADKDYINSRCENFEAFAESLADFTLEYAESVTGVPAEKIAEAARMYAH